jgi:hypothetical protein
LNSKLRRAGRIRSPLRKFHFDQFLENAIDRKALFVRQGLGDQVQSLLRKPSRHLAVFDQPEADLSRAPIGMPPPPNPHAGKVSVRIKSPCKPPQSPQYFYSTAASRRTATV